MGFADRIAGFPGTAEQDMKPLTPLALLLLTFSACTGADEGMWTLDNFPTATVKEQLGAVIDEKWLQKMRSSTVRLDSGCTGSFVSGQGLVLTNNHCVWGCVRNLSSASENLSETGFYAEGLDEERSCPGMRISVLAETEDVTSLVQEATGGKSEAEANEVRKATLSQLEKSCEESSGLACESVNLYRGGQYFLYKYRRYEDVRLAFAPELSIAAFGGDLDNFNFPRWSLDMAMLRVYDNDAPAKIENFLSWRAGGADAGEAVFVAGHPGTTRRLMTVRQLEHRRASLLPQQLILLSEQRGRMLAWSRTGEEPGRIVQQRILNYENAIKIYQNQLRSLMDETQMARKREQEAELRSAVNADPALRKKYGSAWDDIAGAVATYQTMENRYRFIEAGQGFQGSLYDYARTLVRGTAETEKPNAERLREYRDTALPGVEQQLFAEVPIYPEFEQLQLGFSLEKLREWLGPDDATVKSVLGQAAPHNLAGELVSGSTLADAAVRERLWEGGAEAVASSNDPLIALARKVDAQARALRTRYEDEVEAVWDAGSEKIAGARFAIYGTDVYPDATFTLRVTYGSVKGWKEKGQMVEPFTTLGRLYERSTGKPPFRILSQWKPGSHTLPRNTRFNLVADTDIIGGNSGSPMVDAQGRIVGLVFDGNIHSIAGDFWFDERFNRTVAVHPAIMLGAMKEIYGAKRLLDEIRID
jgi:hypothetical protein